MFFICLLISIYLFYLLFADFFGLLILLVSVITVLKSFTSAVDLTFSFCSCQLLLCMTEDYVTTTIQFKMVTFF